MAHPPGSLTAAPCWVWVSQALAGGSWGAPDPRISQEAARADAIQDEPHGERREQHAHHARDHVQAGHPQQPLYLAAISSRRNVSSSTPSRTRTTTATACAAGRPGHRRPGAWWRRSCPGRRSWSRAGTPRCRPSAPPRRSPRSWTCRPRGGRTPASIPISSRRMPPAMRSAGSEIPNRPEHRFAEQREHEQDGGGDQGAPDRHGAPLGRRVVGRERGEQRCHVGRPDRGEVSRERDQRGLEHDNHGDRRPPRRPPCRRPATGRAIRARASCELAHPLSKSCVLRVENAF